MKIQRFADAAALARGAADEFARVARATSGTCNICLSGGSTPKGMFQILAKLGRDALPWDRIELWWGDERCVPPDHPDSNYGMTRANLIEPLKLDQAHVHRIAGERDPETAARDYARELAPLGAPPVFDLVLLGMGPDGHTASLFPGSAGLAERTRTVIANVVTSPLVVRTAPPSGGAAGPGQAPAGARTAPPSGGAAGPGQAPAGARTAPPSGGAAGPGQAPAGARTAPPSGGAAGPGQAPAGARTAPPSGGAAGPGQAPAGAGTATRITVTFPVINAARRVRFLVGGADKAETLARVLEGPPGKYPSQSVQNADLVWFVDEAAAARLAK